MKVFISSGHGKYIRGASGSPVPPQLDEVNEARKVVETVATKLRDRGVSVTTFHDDTSHDQSTNLANIVNHHNAATRDLDVSVHFNAYDHSAHGVECLYVSQSGLAKEIADAIAACGLTNRGAKKRTDLYFLNNTSEPAILIETCFCDNTSDSNLYNSKYDAICEAIAKVISGKEATAPPPGRPERPERPPPTTPAEPDAGEHNQIGAGDTGPDVVELQQKLGVLEADGDFGQITDTWVRAFQKACGLTADGVVGPKTWEEVDALFKRGQDSKPPLPPGVVKQITDIAKASSVYDYAWPDRGIPYPGFIPGIACCFAYAMRLDNDASEAISMAAGDPNTDALAWYKSEFAAQGMHNNKAGIDTLRHLFVMMIGLGPRESSGKYCEGRDMSASNVESDTAEAGLFQTSWNIRNAHPSINPMLDQFWDNPNGFLDVFKEEVYPTASNLDSYGSGDGIRYQFLSRFCPLFTVLVTAVGMRTLRQHWGPINRREVTIRKDADVMLKYVQDLVGSVA